MVTEREFTSTIDLGRIKGAARDGARKGLRLATEHVLDESDKHIPFEEGILERSGRTAVADSGELRGVIYYDTPYAVKQHEDMTLHHDAGRNAKFLENALNSTRDVTGGIIANSIKQELGT